MGWQSFFSVNSFEVCNSRTLVLKFRGVSLLFDFMYHPFLQSIYVSGSIDSL